MSVNEGRRRLLLGSLTAAVAGAARAAPPADAGNTDRQEGQARPGATIDLWPGDAPGMPAQRPVEVLTERSPDPGISDRALSAIARPRMDVFEPRTPNGAAVMIVPGGGYERVAIDKEGCELGRWLAARGFTAFVLVYRLPGDGWQAGPDVALSDAQRALRLVRFNAGRYRVDPERICALGFSAGGHVCADLATRFATPTYEPVDEADALSPRPPVAALIYPVISMSAPIAHAGSRERLLGADGNADLERRHSPHRNVSVATPPCFLVHAEDDTSVPVDNTLLFREALRARGIPVETHLFAEGGHGFGIRNAIGKPAAAWPDLFASWSQSVGLLQ